MPIAVAAVFSLLLVATGLAKLRRPSETARALSALGIPGARIATLALSVVEIIVGVTALLTSAPLALVVQAGLYGAFGVWVWLAMAKGVPIASCGCLGRADTPPYWGHLFLNGLALVASLIAIRAGSVLPVGILEWSAQLFVVVAGAGLAWAILGIGAVAAGRIKI